MAFLGMRGSGQFSANQLPEDWEQMILFEYPNGQTPIFAIQSMFPEQTVKSSTFHWWTETMPARTAAVTNVYIDAALSTPYVYATHQATKGITGATVYVKMAEDDVKNVVPGITVALRDQDRPKVTVRGRVTGQGLNGASSYLAVELIEADDNDDSASTYNLSSVDRIIFMAGAYPWGSGAPEGMSYTPVEYSNNTQIGRNVFSVSETALAEITRTGNTYDHDKTRLMYVHAQGWEMSAIFGHQYSTIDPVSKQPLKYTEGILDWVLKNNPANFIDARYDTDSKYQGKEWIEYGKDFLRDKLKILNRFAPENVLALCGDGASVALNELAEVYGDLNINTRQADYGIRINEWITPTGVLNFKTHPLMSREASTEHMMILYVPENLKLCPLVNNGIDRRTKFETGMVVPGVDGTVDGFISEQGWKMYHPNQWMILDGLGLKNVA